MWQVEIEKHFFLQFRCLLLIGLCCFLLLYFYILARRQVYFKLVLLSVYLGDTCTCFTFYYASIQQYIKLCFIYVCMILWYLLFITGKRSEAIWLALLIEIALNCGYYFHILIFYLMWNFINLNIICLPLKTWQFFLFLLKMNTCVLTIQFVEMFGLHFMHCFLGVII